MASLVHNIVDSARNKLSAKIDNTIAGITNNGLGPIDNKALRATLFINRANPKLPKINFLEYEFGGVIRDIKNTFEMCIRDRIKSPYFWLIIYLIAMFIVVAFLWKYLPIWESLLLILWSTCSLVAGYLVARFLYKH